MQPRRAASHLYSERSMEMRLELSNSKNLDQLVIVCIKQDRKAQRSFYERFAPVMYTVCLRYVRDPSEAEDVLLKGFMKVFQNLKKYRAEGSLEGWVRRIIINEALMYIRRQKNMYLEVDVEEASDAQDVHPDHLAEEDLLQLIYELPVGYRTVFNLYAIEGYSHREIAEMLNINEGTSKSQLSRARQILKQKISKLDMSVRQNNQLG
jgi:RNA polymerase sigma factor (sigma-70 family)